MLRGAGVDLAAATRAFCNVLCCCVVQVKGKACCWPPARKLTKKARDAISWGAPPLLGDLAAHSSVFGRASQKRLTTSTDPSLPFFHRISRTVKNATNTGADV